MRPEDLAREFSRQLLEEIGEDDLKTVIKRNDKPEYGVCCASHDFCDANMVMLSAYTALSGVKEDDVNLDANVELFNKAWDLARDKNFYTGDNR